MNVIREIERINQTELENGIHGGMKSSWHDKYKDSAWLYIGGLSDEFSEGDIICFMSQWGEIEDINLIREKGTNKSLGYAFLKYEDQRSTILAVDNFNGIRLLGKNLRCDHVEKYRLPKEVREREEAKLEENPSADITLGPGHAYNSQQLANEYSINKGIDLWAKPDSKPADRHKDDSDDERSHKRMKDSKEKKHSKSKHEKKHKKDKKRHRDDDGSRYSEEEEEEEDMKLLAYNPDKSIYEKRWSTEERRANAASTILLPGQSKVPLADQARSWRGKRDPTLDILAAAEKKREVNAELSGYKRGEFAGFGGVSRTR